MLPHQTDRVVRIMLKILAMLAITLPLMAQLPAGAVEKAGAPSGKHKITIKQGPYRIAGKVVRPKKAKSRPRKMIRKHETAKQSGLKLNPAPLKWAQNIEPGAPKAAPRPRPMMRPLDPNRPQSSQDSIDPPLQIGRTLYQRNGEISQVETQ